MLRLRIQLAGAPSDAPNRLVLGDLNDIDRRILKEALRTAGVLQQRLRRFPGLRPMKLPRWLSAMRAPPAPAVSRWVVVDSEAGVSHPEIATPFYPVYMPGAALAGARGLVRVRVPRATLAVFGLPYNPRRATDPITADLVVDNGGVVTALRFVQ